MSGEHPPTRSFTPGSIDGALSSGSWFDRGDAELQRDLVSARMFGREPVTIDRFVVEELVGAGASAAVYAARDPLLARRVALKIVARVHGDAGGAAAEHVLREARALADLSHRNVVAIHDVGQWNEHPYIAMELIEGTTLARWLAAEPRSVGQILAAFLDAGRGLAAAHARGHVHRDFKPANVLVASDGRIAVTDFGLVGDSVPACASDGSPRQTRPVGTPAYVAPEQRAGAAAHPTADVYSFAVSLVEAVLGAHPEPESSSAWTTALKRRVPAPVHRALCSALRLDPSRRTPSLAPLLDVLASAVEPRRRRRTRAIATAAIAIAATVALSRGDETVPALPDHLAYRPADLAEHARALLATPGATSRGQGAGLLMLPVPARIPCAWYGYPRSFVMTSEHALRLGQDGQLQRCELATGGVRTIATQVQCLQRMDGVAAAVGFADGRLALYESAGDSWREVSADVQRAGAVQLASLCGISVVPRSWEARPARRLSLEADRTLWYQDGASPRRLVRSDVRTVVPDDALVHAIVTTKHVEMIELASGATLATAPEPQLSALPMLSRDGGRAAVLSIARTVLWWQRGDLAWRTVSHRRSSVIAIDLSPDGAHVALLDGFGELEVREPLSGRRYVLADASIQLARFVDDDRVAAVDKAGRVWRWSLAAQRSMVVADHRLDPNTRGGSMWGLAVSDDGCWIASASSERSDNAVRITSLCGQAQRVVAVGSTAAIHALAIAGDRIIAGTDDGKLHEWDLRSGLELPEHELGTNAWVWTIAAITAGDGRGGYLIGTGRPVDGSGQRGGGRVLLSRGGRARLIFTARPAGNTGIAGLAVSPDGRSAAAVASSGELVAIDLGTEQVRWVAQASDIGEARRVRFTSDGATIATVGDDGRLRSWRASDGVPLASISLGHGELYDLDLRGTRALVAAADGHVGLWDLETRALIRAYRGHGAVVSVARFDATGRWIVSADFSGHACVHHVDREDCHTRLIGHDANAPILNAGFTPDGRVVTSSNDGTVRWWNPPGDLSADQIASELEQRLQD